MQPFQAGIPADLLPKHIRVFVFNEKKKKKGKKNPWQHAPTMRQVKAQGFINLCITLNAPFYKD